MSGPVGRLGVVVVHYGPRGPTIRCLRSIAADGSAAATVVVVDNGPAAKSDWPVAAALPSDFEVTFLASLDNPGYGGGANRGVAALTPHGDYVGWVILNHDVDIRDGFLGAAATALAEDGIGAAGGPIRLGSSVGPLWYAGGRFRPLTGTVVQDRSPEGARRAREVGFIPGAAIAISRRAWEEVGGFDPRFFLYHEDLDLCLRLRRAGWRLWFDPGMRAVHHLGAATGSGRRSAFYLEEMAATRLRPHRSRLYRLYLTLLHTPYVLTQALWLMLEDRTWGIARARALLAGHRRALRDLFD